MPMGRRIIILSTVIACTSFLAVPLPAQERPLTIEQLYLEEGLGIQVLRSQALSSRRENKENALETMRGLVEDGQIAANDSGYIAILRVLATDGSSYQVRTGGRVIYNYPDIRRDAVELLGEIGGEQAIHIIREVLRYERDVMVLSQAIHAVGQTGLDGEGAMTRLIGRILIRENAQRYPDMNLMYVTLRTIEALALEDTEGLASTELIDNLIMISTGPYNSILRDQAQSTLTTLGGL